MTEAIDIKKVIQGSTCDMSVDALTKKGVRQVKVVNQATITRLISQTIDRVMAERSEELSAAERERVLKEARTQFDSIARERVAKERGRVEELDRANRSLHNELEELRTRVQSTQSVETERDNARQRITELEAHIGELERALDEVQENARQEIKQQNEGEIRESEERAREAEERLREFDQRISASEAEVGRLRGHAAEKEKQLAELEGRLRAKEEELQAARSAAAGGGPGLAEALTMLADRIQTTPATRSGDSEMLSALTRLTEKIERMPVGGGGGRPGVVADAPDDVAMDFLTSAGGQVESNIDNVNVKQETAGDVKGALARLKKLQKGGGE